MPIPKDEDYGQREDVGPRLEGEQFVSPGIVRPDGLVPQQFVLPDHDALVELSRTEEGQAQLVAILEQLGVIEPLDVAKARAVAASVRLQSIPPGSKLYQQVEQEIIDRYVGQELMGMSRYIDQQYSTMIAIEGDKGQTMIWLTEDDDRVCEACEANAGEVLTYAEWEAVGLPGTTCYGGNRCRCDLIKIG